MKTVAASLRPSTLLSFHQCLVRRKYRALFTPKARSKPGPKGPSAELIHAIVELKCRNPRFGCPRIALIITNTFGIDIDKNVVRRVLAKHYQPEPSDGPSWLTFLGHTKDSLWSIDLGRCASILLCSHWVLVVTDQLTRRKPQGSEPETWFFPGTAVRRVEITLRLQRDLQVNLAGAALALDLLEETQRLRAKIRSLECLVLGVSQEPEA